MAYLEVLNGPEVGQKALLAQEIFFIGREPTNHLILSDRTVSRRHVVINNIDGRLVISDLKSLKGVLLNGAKISEAVLEDGDEIALGAVRLRFHAEGSASDIPLPGASARQRWKILLAAGIGTLVVAALIFVAFRGTLHLFEDQKLGTLPWQEIEKHYRVGVELFNVQKNTAGARQEWEKALSLDPGKSSSYTQKASKLLETLGGRPADN